MASTQTYVPLCIDLDGTLIRSDTLFESVLQLLKREPWLAFSLPFWLLAGKAQLKARIAQRIDLPAATLPYREDFVAWARDQAHVRPVILVTAAHRRIADTVARHLGFFSEVLATDEVNLKAERKADALAQRFGEQGFDYAGNDRPDVPVWKRARAAIVVGATPAVAAAAHANATVEREFEPAPGAVARLRSWVRALRLYQWIKNVLVFVAPEVARVLDLAVGIPEELHADDAERAGGVALLFLADARQSLGGHRTVAGALVAVGHDDVRNLAAIPHELRDGASGAELGIVRMGGHDENALDLLGHDLAFLCSGDREAGSHRGWPETGATRLHMPAQPSTARLSTVYNMPAQPSTARPMNRLRCFSRSLAFVLMSFRRIAIPTVRWEQL